MNRQRFLDQRRARQTTLLIVTEGSADKAFIDYMKSNLCPRGCGANVKVEARSGGSPGNVITHATRSFKAYDYDQRFILLDSDIPVQASEHRKARSAGYSLIQWRPLCLEAALLQALG